MSLLILFFILQFNSPLTVTSTAFANNHYIPLKYTCATQNVNPALLIDHLPKNTKSLAVIVCDSDAAFGSFDHWIMWNIPPQKKIEENTAPGKQGANSNRENKYTGPCPISGVHTYHFRVYALDTKLNLPDSTNKKTLEKAMKAHIISSGELIGLYP
jgi:Raf kinase inhibitor-like YbhB/YbcL family protein